MPLEEKSLSEAVEPLKEKRLSELVFSTPTKEVEENSDPFNLDGAAEGQ
jgi:hypothetical protein